VTGASTNLRDASELAYQAVDKIRFSGMQYRRDIGGSAL
jgi:phosphoribosylamine-glycine ligase